MKYTLLSFDVNLRPEGFLVDTDSLFAALAQLPDQRDARCLCNVLATALEFLLLAKQCGEDHLRWLAHWVALRKEPLAEVLGLAKSQAPHATTYSRILNKAVDLEALGRVVSQFFQEQPDTGQSVLINLDGKTMRATRPAGRTKGFETLPDARRHYAANL